MLDLIVVAKVEFVLARIREPCVVPCVPIVAAVPPFTKKPLIALALLPSAVATPVPSPLTPVEIGRPVQLVSVPKEGTPMFGVVNTGDVVKATLPLPLTE